MSKTRVAVSWSGGKDSAMMVERLRATSNVEIAALVTTVSSVHDRVSIHGVRRSILHEQARMLQLPLVEVQLGAQTTNESYETAFRDGLVRVQELFPDVRTMAFGDLFLADVRAYRERLLGEEQWSAMFPLWGEDTMQLANYFVNARFRAFISCVDTTQLDAGFAGREYDAQFLAGLPGTVDPCGERGEFHSCVFDGPIFKTPIALQTGECVLRDNRFMFCDLLPCATPA